MMKSLMIVLTSLASFASFADTKTSVIYFGGYGSSESQMQCWAKGAQSQADHSSYSFKGIPFPHGARSDSASAVAGGKAEIDEVVRTINENPGKKYVIAGHSSGAALANRVAELVRDPSQIVLYDLDGFTASSALQKKVKTTCVYAVNKSAALESRNAGAMRSCKTSEAFHDDHCGSQWCLHFSLVNKEAPAHLTSATFGRQGYQGCATNLSWLPTKGKKSEHPPVNDNDDSLETVK